MSEYTQPNSMDMFKDRLIHEYKIIVANHIKTIEEKDKMIASLMNVIFKLGKKEDITQLDKEMD